MQSKGLLLSAVAAVVAFPTAAMAQEASAGAEASGDQSRSPQLEEILVTARRRSESLLDVPVAVTAISREALDRAHITNATQLAQMTPNLLIGDASGGGGGAIAIRGVGSSFIDPGIEQSVGIVIDGVSMGRGRFILLSQFDLQQVEVLKGPQALFFGKNSPAGVISITSAEPTADVSGMLRAGYEFEADERYVEGYISGPLADNLSFRLAGKYSQYDGWIRTHVTPQPNPAIPGFQVPGPNHTRTPAQTSYAGRATLKWSPSADFNATLRFTANHLTGNGDDGNIEAFCSRASAGYPYLSVLSLTTGMIHIDPQSDCNLDRKMAVGALAPGLEANWPAAQKHRGTSWNKLDAQIGVLNLSKVMGPITVTSVTGYTNLESRNLGNYLRSTFAPVWSDITERSRTWSQELRANSDFGGPLNFTLGGYFEDASRYNKFTTLLGFVGFDPANGGSAYNWAVDWKNSNRTYSGYGQMRWKVVPSVELAGGVRYTHEKKISNGAQLYTNALGPAVGVVPAGATVRNVQQFDNWSPEVTLTYKPRRGLMTYAAYKTGYKSGGTSTPGLFTRAYINDPGLLTFRPERSKGFEVGLKGELLSPALRFDVAAYRYTFSDLQLSVINTALNSYFVSNAGKAQTTGVEGSLTWRANENLTLNASAAYNRGKYVSFANAQCYPEIFGTASCPGGATGSYDRSGQPLPRAPRYNLDGGFIYSTEVGSDLKVQLGGQAIYSSSYWTSETGATQGIQRGFWRLNADVRLGAVDDRWELALIGRNLTNEYYRLITADATLGFPGQYGAYMARPRELVVQVTGKF